MPTPIPGWSTERLEAHACIILNRDGVMIFGSEAFARLLGTDPLPLGAPHRAFRADWVSAARMDGPGEEWRASVVSGVLARLGVSSGRVDLPRRTGDSVACFWRYIAIPESDPEYHLFIYEPIEDRGDGPEALARTSLRMEAALFEIQAILDLVCLTEQRREMPASVDLAALTERELDVMKQILDGKPNLEIARDLRVSVDTVKSHAKAIFRKLGVHSRPELMARFVTQFGMGGSVLLQLPLP